MVRIELLEEVGCVRSDLLDLDNLDLAGAIQFRTECDGLAPIRIRAGGIAGGPRIGDVFGDDPQARGLGLESGSRDFGSGRSAEHTSELKSLMSTSYAVYCLQKKKQQ